MTRSLILAVCGFIVLGGEFAWANTVSCTIMAMERTVQLRYENPGEAVPCEIHYSKPFEDMGNQVLWRAEHEAGYCEARFDEFVDKLSGLGWSCDAPDSGTAQATNDHIAGPDAVEDETAAGDTAEPNDMAAPEAPTSE